MKTFLLSIGLIVSIFSFSQDQELVPHTIKQNDVTLTIYLEPGQNYVESDSGHVVYSNNFTFSVQVENLGTHKLFVSGAACKVSLVSAEEKMYKLSTTTHVGKRKISINYGGRPEIIELWIHPSQ